MNIGIVTVYDSSNFGSFLQAYAMKSYLQQKGHCVSFIKWNKKNPIVSDILKRAIVTKRISVKNISSAIDKIKYYKNDVQLLEISEKTEQFDLIVIGSDTLWDIKRSFFSNPMFYGKVDTEVPCVAYAVSCADSQVCDFENKMFLAENIKTIDNIMVRDTHTKEVIEKALNLTSNVVCDPTILMKDRFWSSKTETDVDNSILVYTYSMPKNIVGYLKKYAREQNLKLVSIGLYQPWCTEHINCSALDFPAYLQNAGLVVTNTFHGTIFSILTKSKVVSIEKGNKLKELINSLDAKQIAIRTDCAYEEFIEKAEQKINYSSIDKQLQELRKKSDVLLTDILNSYSIDDSGVKS